MSRRDTNLIAQFLASVTHDTKPRQHAMLSLHSPVDISPVLSPQDFYRSRLVVYVVEYSDLPNPDPSGPGAELHAPFGLGVWEREARASLTLCQVSPT